MQYFLNARTSIYTPRFALQISGRIDIVKRIILEADNSGDNFILEADNSGAKQWELKVLLYFTKCTAYYIVLPKGTSTRTGY